MSSCNVCGRSTGEDGAEGCLHADAPPPCQLELKQCPLGMGPAVMREASSEDTRPSGVSGRAGSDEGPARYIGDAA